MGISPKSELMTLAETCQYLKITPRTLYRYLQTRRLPAFKRIHHVIVRETNEEAWAAAERLISHLDDDTIAKAQASLARFDSVGFELALTHGPLRYLFVHGDGLNDRDRQYLAWRWLSKSAPVATRDISH